MEYHELEKTKVTELREMAHAQGITDAGKYSKEDLVDLLADKLGIEKPHLVIQGIDKRKVKKRLRALKKDRDAALAAKDRGGLKAVRRKMHRLRHKMRKAALVR
ncbi:MAG: Rho termination factor N-terminal domain-containing protein [Candidatus Eisenbacteria bacterium]|nr:Rho termination factor N-terminal domain-containing protein [Candidatus Eisenbacteria bacterium]